MIPTISRSLPPDVEHRAARQYDVFLENYRRLYPQAGEEAIERLLQRVAEAYEARPERLRQLDRDREARPDWFQAPDQVGMMLYVDLFAGKLREIEWHIPYLQELGITYLHLMPLLQPRQGPNDGGYAVADYRQVDSRLGTMTDLRHLAARLHEEGILLVIDFVMNHTAREHAWAQAALAGDSRYQAYYLMFPDRTLPDAYERSLPEIFPDFAPGNFTWQPEISRWVWTTFYDFQWDLDYRNPEVFEAMLEEMLFLANVGVDALRLDAVPFLWKNMGTTCQNQPEVVWLLAAYRALLRMAAPGVLYKSEAIVSPEDIVKYLGAGGYEGKACEIGYHATLMNHLWHALAAENIHLLRSTLSQLPPVPAEATWINYIRCHDDIGWGISEANAAAVGQSGRDTRNFCTDFYTGVYAHSYAEGYVFQRDRLSGEARVSGTGAALAGLQKAQAEADPHKIGQALRRLRLMNGVIFFMRGIPLIFSGDEVGQLNDFSYLLDPEKARDNRWMHRPPMNWLKADRRQDEGSVEAAIFGFHQRFARARKASPALHGRSEDRILWASNPHLFLCERSYGGRSMLLLANFSRHRQSLALGELPAAWQGGHYREAVSELPFHAGEGRLFFSGYGVYWLEVSENQDVLLQDQEIRVWVETRFGEEVRIAGSSEALGRWSQEGAARCSTGPDYPWWAAQVRLPAGLPVFWKWIRVREGRILQWAPENEVIVPGFEA
jgi:amylosucrase